MAQHRDRQRGIHRLMPAGQAGEGKFKLTLLVAIMKPVLPKNRVPACATRQPQGADFVRDLADALGDFGRIELGDQRHARLGDRGFLGGDIG